MKRRAKTGTGTSPRTAAPAVAPPARPTTNSGSGRERSTPASSSFDLRLKVVPGAKTTEVVGWLGDRLKIRVAAPPEGGKANRAVVELLVSALGAESVELIAGHGSAEKIVRVTGADPEALKKFSP